MNIPENPRRDFLKKCGLATVPLVLPAGVASQASAMPRHPAQEPNRTPINFIYDGLDLSPQAYIAKLTEINEANGIDTDYYGNGGAVSQLEATFARITGKEKAIYLPSGTMANQIAIKLLNGHNTKVLVPENSHIFRDEADAAQSVHQKRLVPIGKGQAHYSVADLQATLAYLKSEEVFRSGIGTVVVENPVRRAEGQYVPYSTLQEISSYCRQQGYKLHLDGARLHLASAYTGVSVAEYASLFDTVYISLYKYLHTTGGAILCGDATVIDQVAHQIKILGGTVFQNWANAAMALHYLKDLEARWDRVKQASEQLISALQSIDGVAVTSLPNGTNIQHLRLADDIHLRSLAQYLYDEHDIWVGRANPEGIIRFAINESLITRDIHTIIEAWKLGIEQARG